MKTTIYTLFLLFATAAFAQNGSVLSNSPQPLQISDHAQHASQHALAQETTLLSTSVYSYAKGEVPLSDLGTPVYEPPLGDVARAFRKERAGLAPVKPANVLEK
jgi:hypothetical protein